MILVTEDNLWEMWKSVNHLIGDQKSCICWFEGYVKLCRSGKCYYKGKKIFIVDEPDINVFDQFRESSQ